jgi:hypothetical protein
MAYNNGQQDMMVLLEEVMKRMISKLMHKAMFM